MSASARRGNRKATGNTEVSAGFRRVAEEVPGRCRGLSIIANNALATVWGSGSTATRGDQAFSRCQIKLLGIFCGLIIFNNCLSHEGCKWEAQVLALDKMEACKHSRRALAQHLLFRYANCSSTKISVI